MDFTKSHFVSYILAYSGVIGLVWFLFSKAEDILKPKVKKDISKWLKNIDPEEHVKNWPGQFAAMFDRIFGEKHMSWKCFRRSSLASITSAIIVTFVWIALRPNEIRELFEDHILFGIMVISMSMIFWSLVFNLLPDYLSLLQTRLIIRWMSSSNSLPIILILVICDLIVSL